MAVTTGALEQARDLRECFARDGAVRVAGALDGEWLARCREAFDFSLAHPSPFAAQLYRQPSGAFYQDLSNMAVWPAYDAVLRESPIADLVAALWGSDQVWFLYEQVFRKQAGAPRRTPWHQDAPYLSIEGDHLAVVWIPFEKLGREHSLELVRGSHRGTLYDGSSFDPADDTAPIYPGSDLPRLPDIEADRSRWNIVSWPVEPGDVVVFHPGTLHGGAPTGEGLDRHTLSLRFFGEHAFYAQRPRPAGPIVPGLHDALAPGDRFRHPAFPKLRGDRAGLWG